MNNRLHAGLHRLRELIFRRKERLLRLEDRQQVRRTLLILKLCDSKRFTRRVDLAYQMTFSPRVDATVDITETPGGGATVNLRF